MCAVAAARAGRPGADTRAPSQLEAAVDFLDTKLPTIKGRPAIRECYANLKPGITVSLVSLPLSISLAIAADATPASLTLRGLHVLLLRGLHVLLRLHVP